MIDLPSTSMKGIVIQGKNTRGRVVSRKFTLRGFEEVEGLDGVLRRRYELIDGRGIKWGLTTNPDGCGDVQRFLSLTRCVRLLRRASVTELCEEGLASRVMGDKTYADKRAREKAGS